MDLWQLKIFCKVVELKSFSKAGEAVFLSQPTVSSHIKDLEEHLGTPLVDRLARSVVPTKAGELLYGYARRLITLRDEAEAAMAAYLGQKRGKLILGGSTIPGTYLLPRLIGRFVQEYPDVQVSLSVGDTAEIMEKITEGEIEIGIVGAQDRGFPLLQQIPLVQDELFVVVPKDHRWARRQSITVAELLEEPFIARELGSGTLRAIERVLREAGFHLSQLRIVAQMGSTEAVRQGIKNRAGISILSVMAVEEDLQAGSLKTLSIKELDFKRHFYLTRHIQRTPSPICRTFIEFLSAEFNQTIEAV
ncbi:MAG: selenium metabolism-associated LysR family transcriptional regulator [Desulfobacteraceae bacterium]|nr:selenium metabolism-associated LysR family transcriptional regulator [Desulfobacteraceae bacterium]